MNASLIPLLTSGPKTAADIARHLGGISQPTVSRLLRRQGPAVRMLGRARAARYGLRRAIRELDGDLPVYRVEADGSLREVGLLAVLHGGCWYESLEDGTSELYPDLPWFLDDQRPQGFLGRSLVQAAAELGLPPRLSDWSGDHALYWLARRGEDAVGNLIVGTESLQRHREAAAPVAVGRDDYPALAARALAGAPGGSSAGGEQPKFTTWIADAHAPEYPQAVLVKFSEPLATPVGRRWGDLLIAEAMAATVIAEAGFAAAPATAFERGGRMFLEVQRFDRVGARGRRGVFSLAVVDDQFVGSRRNWQETALALVAQGRLASADADRIAWLSAFGACIGNSDMHHGNLSLLFEGRWPLRLAPNYDMLPMAWAPQRGELPPTPEFRPRLTLSRALHQIEPARAAAVDYWQRLAAEPQVSVAFRGIAADNARRLASASL